MSKTLKQTVCLLIFFIALSANSLAAEQYPAADFTPKVIYIAEPVNNTPLASPPKTANHDEDLRYPAAYFQPKVIFISPEAK